MKANLRTVISALLVLAFLSHSALSNATDACAFDNDTLSFKGTLTEQAKCLLRPVGIRGNVGVAVAKLERTHGSTALLRPRLHPCEARSRLCDDDRDA